MCVVNLVKRLAGISFPVRCYFHSVIMAEGHSPKKCKFEDSSDEDTPQDTLLSNNNCPETITDRADKTDDATFKVCFIYISVQDILNKKKRSALW